MTTDSFFQQGVTHEVCEDYALHGEGFGIVSDGCSNGGGPSLQTDWGSRILCKAAEQNLKILLTPDGWTGSPEAIRRYFFREVGVSARTLLRGMGVNTSGEATKGGGLNRDCLTATLGVVYQHGPLVRTLLMGDGVVIAHRRTGEWLIKVYEPVKGAPFYLKYAIFEEVETYYKQFGGEYRVTTYTGDINKPEAVEVTVQDVKLQRECPWFEESFPRSEYQSVYVCTDGLNSFYTKVNTGTSKHNEPVSILQVLGVLLDGITYRNGFLRLQRNWAFKRPTSGTFVQRQWHNADDVSAAAVQVDAGETN